MLCVLCVAYKPESNQCLKLKQVHSKQIQLFDLTDGVHFSQINVFERKICYIYQLLSFPTTRTGTIILYIKTFLSIILFSEILSVILGFHQIMIMTLD